MGLKYEFMDKNTTKFVIPTSYYKQMDDTRYKPERGAVRLDYNWYLNIRYGIKDPSRDAKVRVKLVREDPVDPTGYHDIILGKGYEEHLDSSGYSKYWSPDDLGRFVHLELRAYNTTYCYLTTRYVAYSLVW